MSDKFYYTDMQIVGNLINKYLEMKDYKKIKALCSSIKKINHLNDDYRKLVTFLEKNNQLSDYLFNFHDKSYNFLFFKDEFKKINNIDDDSKILKIYSEDELVNTNSNNYRLFTKIIGNTKQLSSLLDVKKMQIMWIANTPVWFVPYENLKIVKKVASDNNIDIIIEKNGI